MHNQTDSETHSMTRYFNIYLNLFYIIFGNLGNLLKVAFFLQRPLRSLPCSFYIIFATFSDFVTLNNLPIRQLYIDLATDDPSIKLVVDWSYYQNESILDAYQISTNDIILCKLRSYLHMFSTDLSSQLLLFASINRFCFNYFRRNRQKKNLLFNQIFSHRPHIRKLCLTATFLCAVLSLHHIFNFTIRTPSEGCVPCNTILWTGWILTIHCFLLPMLMIVFGFLTLKNRRRRSDLRMKRIYMPFLQKSSPSSLQKEIDNQLTAMIFSEIVITILSSLPYGTYAFYHLLYNTQYQITYKTEWIPIVVRMSMYFEASCGFYIYILTLKTLRKRFWNSFIQLIPSLHCWN